MVWRHCEGVKLRISFELIHEHYRMHIIGAASLLRAARSQFSFNIVRAVSGNFLISYSSSSEFQSVAALQGFRSPPAVKSLQTSLFFAYRGFHFRRSGFGLRATSARCAARAVSSPVKRKFCGMATENAYKNILTSLPKPGGGEFGKYYSFTALNDPRREKLPYSIRILLELAIRNCDNFQVTKDDVEKIIDWENAAPKQVEISFKPARVLLQDFTGVPAVVDLASMRDGMNQLGGDTSKINPLIPVDLVVDHSVQVDVARAPNALKQNMEYVFNRNKERFAFLKWGSSAFNNMLVVPPGSGIVHRVNLEYLGRVVFNSNGMLFPDSVVGTDSHTTMIDGLGVAGWGVGGIEAESTMLGQSYAANEYGSSWCCWVQING